METVAGVFQSRADADSAVGNLHSLGIPNDRIALLTPGMSDRQVEHAVPTSDSEQPGMGKAMGGTVGGAMGVAGGATLGAAAASLLVPGVGPVIAGGILGAAILGAGGTATGMAAGEALEEGLETGLPHDELYIYEDALRNGRSVVIAFIEEGATDAAQKALASAGAESIDAARESWWLGLRDDEEAHYQTTGKNFQTDETSYRRGFEAALQERGTAKNVAKSAAAVESDEAFRRGYERGQAYQRTVREKYTT
jgi:CRISPR/Cas system CMR-associated protein Cmr5 small subunit